MVETPAARSAALVALVAGSAAALSEGDTTLFHAHARHMSSAVLDTGAVALAPEKGGFLPFDIASRTRVSKFPSRVPSARRR